MAGYTIGIDEAGRGALAGPVFVAAVALAPPERAFFARLCRGRDSKKMQANERERIYREIVRKTRQGKVFFVISFSCVRFIERENISRAANISAYRAYRRICSGLCDGHRFAETVILDGGLFLKSKDAQAALAREKGYRIRTCVRADETFVEVSLASVVAKCSRDAYMRRLDGRYPVYGFREHKGYGTRRHVDAIKAHGSSDMHRLTFLKKYSSI